MARKGLPKKYAKMGFKRGWREYKKTLKRPTTKRRTYARPPARRRKGNMARRKYVRRAKKSIMTKPFIDGVMSSGGKMLVRKVFGGGPIYEAGIDIGLGLFRHNKTLLAQGIVEGATAFLPGLKLGGGSYNGGYIA